MAFSPFDIFRRNQKIFMSAIVIFVMFIFTLQFGKGDFFDWVTTKLGSKKAKGEVLAEIDGDKFRESEAAKLRASRARANEYMATAAVKAKERLTAYIKENATKSSPENRTALAGFPDSYADGSMFLRMPPEQRMQLVQQFPQFATIYRSYTTSLSTVDKILKNPNAKPEDLDIAVAIRKFLFLGEVTARGDRHYFHAMSNKNVKDSIEFTLWLKKAEQLNIRFRTDDVDGLIEQEFMQLKAEDREKILAEMAKEARTMGVTKDMILDAIGDEFRVRMAQVAVMGLNGIRTNGSNGHSPFDYYEFYRSESSPARFAVISVPVENYLPKVAGEPSESELREIFSKARNTEPDPAEVKPGLKKGREVKLGWVEITGKEPFYATAAADALVKAEVAAKLAGLLAEPMGASLIGKLPGGISLAAALAVQKLENPGLQGAYDDYRINHTSDIESRWYRGTPSALAFLNPVLDSSYANPQVVAATVGLSAMPLGTLGNKLTAANGTLVSADGAERKQRLFAGLASLSAPNLGGPTIFAQYVGNLAAMAQATPPPVPLAAVKPLLVKQTSDQLRYRLARQDIQTFQTELEKINKGEDKEKNARDAEAYIAKFASPASNWIDKDGKPQLGRGLKLGGSTNFYNVHTIGDDPGLAPLKERLSGPHAGIPSANLFGPKFFMETDFQGQSKPATGLYAPMLYPDPNASRLGEFQSQYLVWRTADSPSEAAKDFDKSRAKCVEIWRRQKARALAKQAADELAAQTSNLGANFLEISGRLENKKLEFRLQFADPAARDRVEYTELTDVSKYVREPFNPQTGSPFPYLTRFSVKPSKEIPYPTQKMSSDLVANSTNPLSTSLVMVDQPESNYYVAILIDRRPRDQVAFFNDVYFLSPMSSQISGALHSVFEQESYKQAREEAVELLKAEFKYDKESANLEKLSGSGE